VRWDDPALGIDWSIAAPTLSIRDAAARPLAEIDNLPTYEK
jgi:dTDP-4-dehydrorhamnose 3,5-epimerase